jgi:hypothetical protein
MDPFASSPHNRETIALPFDPGATVTIRKLTGADIEKAQGNHLASFVGGRSARGWAPMFQQRMALGIATDAEAVAAIRDPLAGYDRSTVLKAGLTGWSYLREDGKPRNVTPAAIDDLVDEAAEFIARAILHLTKPELFETADEREAAEKKGDGPAPVV